MNKFGIGQPVRRKEDLRLLRGRGEFSDDLNLPDQAHAVVLRSPHAHARIRAIDKTAALNAPGVRAVLTGRDYVADGLAPIPNNPVPPDLPISNLDGSKPFVPPDYPLTLDKVRHVGEHVRGVDAAEHRVFEHAQVDDGLCGSTGTPNNEYAAQQR